MSEMRFAQLEPWLPRVSLWILALCISALNKNLNLDLLAPSGALVVIMVYYIPAAAAQPTFSNFSNSSDSKVKVKVKEPNMCYIF